MCTLTWGHTALGYHVHFNRDESRVRQRAIQPQLYSNESSQYIAPIDKDALGTWIFVNSFGLTACLLNNYIDTRIVRGQRSRGLLLRDLSAAESIDHAEHLLGNAGITDYAPFDIFLFDRHLALNISWNGKKQTRFINNDNFKSSSGFETEAVIESRKHSFRANKVGFDELRNFHRSHLPKKSSYSVCMHRPDARTQSYTEIIIDDRMASMCYSDGPPCTSKISSPLTVQIIKN